jgi:hypothetical protein
VNGRFALSFHLIEMIGDAVDFPGRIFDGPGRAICRLGRFVCGFGCLGRRLFGVRGGCIRLGCRGFGLPGLLLALRRASGDSDREDQDGQFGKKLAHR